jgi:lipid II:glycine glycyltransferase (peptidoglycan interpeptide bridge formation enzyme)
MKNIHPLQTKAWGQFRRAWGNEVLETKYGIITVHGLPLTDYRIGMFIKGPVPTKPMLADLKKIAEEQNLIFIKLEPNVKKNSKLTKLLIDSGAVPGKTLFTPTTFQIDLTKSEEELLKSFHPKTRYNIRYAERHGVTVSEDNSDKAFEKYIELMRETVERQNFYAHDEKYHRLMWKYLRKANIAHLLVAKKGKEVLTTWILFKNKDSLYYPYGAWSGKNQNLQPNSLMMWTAIKFGKKHNLRYFDLWGREFGKGFTRFKEGFRPEVVEFLGTWDLITSHLYWPYRLAEFFRWRLLRLRTKFSKPSF